MQNTYKLHWPAPLTKKATTQHPRCNDVLFLHYKVQKKLLRKLVPKELELDNFDGDYWISIMGFKKVNSFFDGISHDSFAHFSASSIIL